MIEEKFNEGELNQFEDDLHRALNKNNDCDNVLEEIQQIENDQITRFTVIIGHGKDEKYFEISDQGLQNDVVSVLRTFFQNWKCEYIARLNAIQEVINEYNNKKQTKEAKNGDA